jgi:hypothetical protein
MESIKIFFSPKKSRSKGCPQISSPISGSSKKLTVDIDLRTSRPPAPSSSHHHQENGNSRLRVATSIVAPQDRGREETMAWLKSGTSESLVTLLTDRDRAAKQARHGPKTKGTEEVQLILSKPSSKTVEQLHHVRRQAEVVAGYGAAGVVAYNFSKSLGWNQALASKIPALRLRNFGPSMKEIRTVSTSCIPPVPFTPVDWLVLPTSTSTMTQEPKSRKERKEPARSLSPISELGGWGGNRSDGYCGLET